jgi:hypothetical protein
MTTLPTAEEWNTSQLPGHRRAYLDSRHSFEEIARTVVSEARVLDCWSEPYRHPPKGAPTGIRQVCFRVCVSEQTFDLLYNASDGLRGRYWQSPDVGFLATCSLISSLEPDFLAFAEKHPPNARRGQAMGSADICASLRAASAKIWIREKDASGNTKINLNVGPQLKVLRWEQNESRTGHNRPFWRWTPCENEIEIKGALLDPQGGEHVPEGKRDRSCQIHLYGFT